MKQFTLVLLFCGVWVHTTHAQLISVKSVPVATGDQFLLFPSTNLGMGGVTIALDDPLLDPFSNPARSSQHEGIQIVSTPLFYSISMNDDFNNSTSTGYASTLPVGVLTKKDNSFGGALVAWQQLSINRPESQVFIGTIDVPENTFAPSFPRKPSTLTNMYAFVTSGFKSDNEKVSMGMSATLAKLNGVEGVRLLYSQGADAEQDGTLAQFRLGLNAAVTSSSTLDVIVLHHRYQMSHKLSDRTEEDETNGVGVSLNYVKVLEDAWHVGGHWTGNWQWHPKIPNYDIMQIPRDPGNTSAYNVGAGIAHINGNTTFGLDLIYEPIRSHTWADALVDISILDAQGLPSGTFIFAGEKTVENFFRFNNRIVRAGIQQTGETVDLQFGVNVHTIRYHLDQYNYELQFDRTQNEKWSEWTLNAGIALKFSTIEIRYLGRLALGTGQPGLEWGQWGWGCPRCRDAAGLESGFIVAPGGSLALQEARVFTSQFTILVPLRGGR